MPSLIRLSISMVFFAAFASPSALAQTPEQERIKQLEQENDALRAEMAQLRLQLSQIKRELEQLKPDQLETVEDKTDDASIALDSDKEEKDDKTKTTVIRSADEIFREIPNYLRPEKDGWDQPKTQTVGGWLKDNFIGKQFSARKKISEVTARYDPRDRIWNVVIAFEEEEMTYMGWKMEEKIYPITLLGDKEFAEAAKKKYRPGRTIQVSGTITRIHWATIIQHKRDQNWHPKFCQLSIHAYEPW